MLCSAFARRCSAPRCCSTLCSTLRCVDALCRPLPWSALPCVAWLGLALPGAASHDSMDLDTVRVCFHGPGFALGYVALLSYACRALPRLPLLCTMLLCAGCFALLGAFPGRAWLFAVLPCFDAPPRLALRCLVLPCVAMLCLERLALPCVAVLLVAFCFTIVCKTLL